MVRVLRVRGLGSGWGQALYRMVGEGVYIVLV